MSHNSNNNNINRNCNKHLIEQGSLVAGARACSADLYEPIEIRSSDNCYELNPGSSLRVRFRMITHQSSRHSNINNNVNNNNRRINSTTSSVSTASSSVIHSTSMSPANISPDSTILPPMPQNHNKIFLSHQTYQQKINETVSNHNQHSQSPCIIYNKYINQNKQQNLQINITPNSQGSCSSSTSSSSSTTHRSTTRTFKLTEDLKSNIRFDITLKPTLSIRDNRIDPSCTSKSNSSFNINNSNGCNLTTRSTSCDTRNSNNEIELPIKTSPTMSHKSVPPSNHVPLNSSITFKIKNIELNDNNTSTNHSNNDPINRTSSKRNSNRYNSQSPFTFIETYSARRGISLSPNSINNERILYKDSKKVNRIKFDLRLFFISNYCLKNFET